MRFAALWVCLVLGTVAEAQVEGHRAPDVCRLPISALAVAPPDVQRARRAVPDCTPATEGTQFEVTYTGFPPGAEAAFQAAVDTWACNVRSDQVVRVAASWTSLSATTLGSAGPFLFRNFDGAPTRDVWYPAALADALSGRDLGDGGADIEASFNSDFSDWHFGPGPPPSGTYDLTTVVLHELAHGLGFIGALEVEGGRGFIGQDPEGAFSYDLHTQTASGVSLLDSGRFPDGSAALASALVGSVAFAGQGVLQASGGTAPIYAPRPWVQGGSYSHLDEAAYPANTPDGLMTPFIARNEVIDAPGAVVCGVMADVGWTLAGRCDEQVGPLSRLAPQVTLRFRGPNPSSLETAVEVSSPGSVSARVVLVDVLGRVVTDYGTTVLVAGTPRTVTIRSSGLASGVYFLSVRGGPEAALLPLVVRR